MVRLSRALEKAIFKRDKGVCRICGRETEFDDGEIDHIVAKSKDGTDDPDNLQWACHRCNKLKGSNLTNEQVRRVLCLPEKIEEIMQVKTTKRSLKKLSTTAYQQKLPILSQDGLDKSVIEKCIQEIHKSFQSETIIPEICERIIGVKETTEEFVNLGFHYRLPREWFMPYEITKQVYCNDLMFSQFGRMIALSEQHYVQQKILDNNKIRRIDSDFSPEGILNAVKTTASSGYDPNLISVPIDYWIKMHHWAENAGIKYSTKIPKPRLSATLNINETKLKLIHPIGKFPKEPILLSSRAISWKVKKHPTGALYAVLGNHQIYPLKWAEILAGTSVKCELLPEGVAVLNFDK